MHAVGLHSALAIKRQRKRRDEQRRAEERRYSSQSYESGLTSLGESGVSLNKSIHQSRKTDLQNSSSQEIVDSKVVTSMGMLHVGVVFLVLGIFLLISGILPSDFALWKIKVVGIWWNELITIGIFSIIVGCFLIMLNRMIVKKEERYLEQYVQSQLTRSKSGHRLENDLDTGVLSTEHIKEFKNIELSSYNINQIMTKTSFPSITSPRYPLLLVQDNHKKIEPNFFLEQISEKNVISNVL